MLERPKESVKSDKVPGTHEVGLIYRVLLKASYREKPRLLLVTAAIPFMILLGLPHH